MMTRRPPRLETTLRKEKKKWPPMHEGTMRSSRSEIYWRTYLMYTHTSTHTHSQPTHNPAVTKRGKGTEEKKVPHKPDPHCTHEVMSRCVPHSFRRVFRHHRRRRVTSMRPFAVKGSSAQSWFSAGSARSVEDLGGVG